MKRLLPIAALVLGIAAVAVAQVTRTPSPAGAEVYFVGLKDGDTVSSPLTVRFGLKGMGVAPAGIAFAGAGHHHLIVDKQTPPLNAPVPSDANHLHFGKGQTETTIELKPGKHTLQLIVGDQLHIPHEPAIVSKVITVNVK
jgi:hypothetical protein